MVLVKVVAVTWQRCCVTLFALKSVTERVLARETY